MSGKLKLKTLFKEFLYEWKFFLKRLQLNHNVDRKLFVLFTATKYPCLDCNVASPIIDET